MKKNISCILGVLFALSALAPGVVFGQGDNSNNGRKQNGICTVISNRLSKLRGEVGDQDFGLARMLGENTKTRDERFESFQNRYRERWELRDENLEEHFFQLESRAGTDAEKAAVIDFVRSVKLAVSSYRSSVEQAIDKFREGVNLALEEKSAAVESAIEARRSSFGDFLDDAKAKCEAGDDVKTIRESIVSLIKGAQDSFRNSISSIRENFRTDFDNLKKEKQESLKLAKDEFRSVMETAQNSLKEAMGVDASSGDNNGGNTEN